jgi:hypothetical protein
MDVKPWELEQKLRTKYDCYYFVMLVFNALTHPFSRADERASEAIERERQEMEANLARMCYHPLPTSLVLIR